jgi:hypothetical protein
VGRGKELRRRGHPASVFRPQAVSPSVPMCPWKMILPKSLPFPSGGTAARRPQTGRRACDPPNTERILPAIQINIGSRQNHGWQNHFAREIERRMPLGAPLTSSSEAGGEKHHGDPPDRKRSKSLRPSKPPIPATRSPQFNTKNQRLRIDT